MNAAGTCSIELPRYKCHKEVWALKIRSITKRDIARADNRETTDGSALLFPDNLEYDPIKVDVDYMDKHRPQAGGYYVVYKDGYKSFSPADAFEDGYTLQEVQ